MELILSNSCVDIQDMQSTLTAKVSVLQTPLSMTIDVVIGDNQESVSLKDGELFYKDICDHYSIILGEFTKAILCS